MRESSITLGGGPRPGRSVQDAEGRGPTLGRNQYSLPHPSRRGAFPENFNTRPHNLIVIYFVIVNILCVKILYDMLLLLITV